MLTVTLYKNCILNDSYSEVFDQVNIFKDQKTAHEYYLSTLTNLVIDCGETYVTNSGSINFDLKPSESQYIYEYNYMKLHDSNLPDDIADRYAFIDNITIVNTIAVVNYSEDIWANYSKKMNLRMGYLSRSYILSYGLKNNTSFNIPFYNLPMLYRSNDIPIIEPYGATEEYYCCASMQVYGLAESGTPTSRHCFNVIFQNKNIHQEHIKPCDVKDIVKLVTASSSDTIVGSDAGPISGRELYYEITKIILLPLSFLQFPLAKPPETYSIGSFKTNSNFKVWDATLVLGFNSPDFSKGKKIVISGTDFKLLGIGPFNNIQQIDLNGSSIDLIIHITVTDTTFDIYMVFQNKIVNITESFVYDVPIGVDSNESTQLKAMTRELQNKAYDSQQINTGIGIGQNIMSGLFGGISAGLSFMDPETASMDGINQALDSTANIARGINSMVMIERQRNLTNAKLYKSNTALKINTRDSLTAAKLGIVKLKVNPDNEQEVQEQIKETGYVVEETINFDIFKEYKYQPEYDGKYNIMKFDALRMNGAFPQDIKTKLENILLSGFKIYYGI